MVDYSEGIKRDVAEIKFLIHDLRVEHFINEVIHYHVTINTDLEIYNVEQAQVLHGADLEELKAKGVELRKAFRAYSAAVRNFAPDKTVLLLGTRYVETIRNMCELILNPRWGRVDRVLPFLPEDSRSYQSRNHYRNCIRWIGGVYYRIQFFLEEQAGHELYEEFDVGQELYDFTRNVVYGYVMEKGRGRVELEVEQLDSAVIGGNRHRFRRMFFNMVMNAVDAMAGRKLGVVTVSEHVEGDQVVLRIRDNGTGMTDAKIRNLLTDRETLDGELHSLGFVFVRRTIAQLRGELSVESEVDRGTTITVRLPHLADVVPSERKSSPFEKYDLPWDDDVQLDVPKPSGRPESAYPPSSAPASDAPPPNGGEGHDKRYGDMVLDAYRRSEAESPGSIFAMGVTEADEVDFFTHRAYEKYWNISHEDLSPTYYEATVRGRIEEDDEKNPVVILKAPQNVAEYFDFRDTPQDKRSGDRFVAMVHDEYIRIARKLVQTGLPSDIGVFMTGTKKFFPDEGDALDPEPFPLGRLAELPLTGDRVH